MTPDRLLFWTPRALALLFALFLSLFALDAGGHGLRPLATLGVVAVHLVPTAVVLAVLVVAWRWESLGAGIFIGLALGYLLLAGRVHWSAVVIISGSLAALGALFLVTAHQRRRQDGPAA